MIDAGISFGVVINTKDPSNAGRVKVEIPRRLNNKQKDLLREFEATTSDREYDNRKNFLDRVKELFQ